MKLQRNDNDWEICKDKLTEENIREYIDEGDFFSKYIEHFSKDFIR